MSLVNTNLLRHPLNWLTIWSMFLILFYVAHLIMHAANGSHPGTSMSGSTSTEGAGGPGTDVPA